MQITKMVVKVGVANKNFRGSYPWREEVEFKKITVFHRIFRTLSVLGILNPICLKIVTLLNTNNIVLKSSRTLIVELFLIINFLLYSI